MTTIVEQLQADAINPDIAASTLLRKTKLVAAKLKLPSVEAWVEQELNGYDEEVPDYRILGGQPRAYNPVRGWIPLGGDARIMSMISKAYVRDPISGIENVATHKGKGSLFWHFGPEQVEMPNKMAGVQWPQMGLELSKGQMVSIVDRVRGLVLDWAIMLERQGILGSEIGFNEHDKKLARETNVYYNIGSIASIAGTVNSQMHGANSRLNLGSHDASTNIAKSENVFQELKDQFAQQIDDAAERRKMIALVEKMNAAKDGSGFGVAYQKFMASAANHMTIIGPFLPMLAAYFAS
jgi:hypothetical protein